MNPGNEVRSSVVSEGEALPRLTDLKGAQPDISTDFKTEHHEGNPDRGDGDVRSAGTDRVDDRLHVETRSNTTRLPVCNPAFLKAQTKPRERPDLRG